MKTQVFTTKDGEASIAFDAEDENRNEVLKEYVLKVEDWEWNEEATNSGDEDENH